MKIVMRTRDNGKVKLVFVPGEGMYTDESGNDTFTTLRDKLVAVGSRNAAADGTAIPHYASSFEAIRVGEVDEGDLAQVRANADDFWPGVPGWLADWPGLRQMVGPESDHLERP